jgi:exosortase/archaeosortase family protein
MTERSPAFLFLLPLAAFWPVLHWYGLRTVDGSDEPWGLLALATAVVITVLAGSRSESTTQPMRLGAATLALLVYAASFHFLPHLGRAICAVVTLILIWRGVGGEVTRRPALAGLLVLSLPLLATLQYVLGYPMRVLCGILSVALLRLNGLAVSRDGTALLFDGMVVAIDAPCSGVRMLWVGLYLAMTLCALRGLDVRRTLTCAVATVGAVLAGNALRTSALFYSEAGLWPHDLHQFAGMVCFAVIAAGVIVMVRRLESVPA